MSRIRVTYNDPTVHCVDVLNGAGQRVARIRPCKDGISLTVEERNGSNAFLEVSELEELVAALGHLRPL